MMVLMNLCLMLATQLGYHDAQLQVTIWACRTAMPVALVALVTAVMLAYAVSVAFVALVTVHGMVRRVAFPGWAL